MSLITCPECKKEISDTVENCPHCGYKVKPKQEDKKESTGNNKWLIRGIYLALIILIGTCVVNIATDSNKPKEKRTSITEHEAKAVAEGEVKENLKSPSTAKFSGLADTKISPISGGYKVTGYVDSQNGFGAMIRSIYSIEIVVDKETGNIQYSNLKIE